MTGVVCSSCGGEMTAERVTLPDGRRRFSLTCEVCWDGIVEYTRREPLDVTIGGEFVRLGFITVPA